MNHLKTSYSIDDDYARRISERVYVLLKSGHFDAAHIAIDQAFASKQDVKNAPLLDMPIAMLKVDDKIINLFEKMGYKFVGDLVGITDEHLLKTVPMCGEKSIKLLRNSVTKEITRRRLLEEKQDETDTRGYS
jgi:DNA-directed RNA polymerase alpha subunit